MEIVLIRHGQPEWMVNDVYQQNPNLSALGHKQAELSSTIFEPGSMNELWVSPLKRAQQTHQPFVDKNIAKEIFVFDWLQEMEDEEEISLYGKSTDEIMAFFEKRNTQSFEEWTEGPHGVYMKTYRENIVSNLEKELKQRGIVCSDDTYDRQFTISDNSPEKLMIISHAGTMSVLLSYFLNMDHYAWTWRKFLPRHTGHTRLRSTSISGGHFFRLKEFNNVSFIESDEEQTY